MSPTFERITENSLTMTVKIARLADSVHPDFQNRGADIASINRLLHGIGGNIARTMLYSYGKHLTLTLSKTKPLNHY